MLILFQSPTDISVGRYWPITHISRSLYVVDMGWYENWKFIVKQLHFLPALNFFATIMFDNHIWGITAKNVCMSNDISVINQFYSLISVSAPKIAHRSSSISFGQIWLYCLIKLRKPPNYFQDYSELITTQSRSWQVQVSPTDMYLYPQHTVLVKLFHFSA